MADKRRNIETFLDPKTGHLRVKVDGVLQPEPKEREAAPSQSRRRSSSNNSDDDSEPVKKRTKSKAKSETGPTIYEGSSPKTLVSVLDSIPDPLFEVGSTAQIRDRLKHELKDRLDPFLFKGKIEDIPKDAVVFVVDTGHLGYNNDLGASMYVGHKHISEPRSCIEATVAFAAEGKAAGAIILSTSQLKEFDNNSLSPSTRGTFVQNALKNRNGLAVSFHFNDGDYDPKRVNDPRRTARGVEIIVNEHNQHELTDKFAKSAIDQVVGNMKGLIRHGQLDGADGVIEDSESDRHALAFTSSRSGDHTYIFEAGFMKGDLATLASKSKMELMGRNVAKSFIATATSKEVAWHLTPGSVDVSKMVAASNAAAEKSKVALLDASRLNYSVYTPATSAVTTSSGLPIPSNKETVFSRTYPHYFAAGSIQPSCASYMESKTAVEGSVVFNQFVDTSGNVTPFLLVSVNKGGFSGKSYRQVDGTEGVVNALTQGGISFTQPTKNNKWGGLSFNNTDQTGAEVRYNILTENATVKTLQFGRVTDRRFYVGEQVLTPSGKLAINEFDGATLYNMGLVSTTQLADAYGYDKSALDKVGAPEQLPRNEYYIKQMTDNLQKYASQKDKKGELKYPESARMLDIVTKLDEFYKSKPEPEQIAALDIKSFISRDQNSTDRQALIAQATKPKQEIPQYIAAPKTEIPDSIRRPEEPAQVAAKTEDTKEVPLMLRGVQQKRVEESVVQTKPKTEIPPLLRRPEEPAPVVVKADAPKEVPVMLRGVTQKQSEDTVAQAKTKSEIPPLLRRPEESTTSMVAEADNAKEVPLMLRGVHQKKAEEPAQVAAKTEDTKKQDVAVVKSGEKESQVPSNTSPAVLAGAVIAKPRDDGKGSTLAFPVEGPAKDRLVAGLAVLREAIKDKGGVVKQGERGDEVGAAQIVMNEIEKATVGDKAKLLPVTEYFGKMTAGKVDKLQGDLGFEYGKGRDSVFGEGTLNKLEEAMPSQLLTEVNEAASHLEQAKKLLAESGGTLKDTAQTVADTNYQKPNAAEDKSSAKPKIPEKG